MTNKIKFLIFLLLILLGLAGYFILAPGSVKPAENSREQAKHESLVLPDEDYKAKTKEIFSAYEKLAVNNDFTEEKIEELKNKLLEIKGFQAKFQNFHLNFVLALDRMENYLKSRGGQGKNASQQIASQLKADYDWLNN